MSRGGICAIVLVTLSPYPTCNGYYPSVVVWLVRAVAVVHPDVCVRDRSRSIVRPWCANKLSPTHPYPYPPCPRPAAAMFVRQSRLRGH